MTLKLHLDANQSRIVHELITHPAAPSLTLHLKPLPRKSSKNLGLFNMICPFSMLGALQSTLYFPSPQPGVSRLAFCTWASRPDFGSVTGGSRVCKHTFLISMPSVINSALIYSVQWVEKSPIYLPTLNPPNTNANHDLIHVDHWMAKLVINLARKLELINLSSELHFDLGLIRPIFHSGEYD